MNGADAVKVQDTVMENKLLQMVKKRWFIVSLVAVIILAKVYPYLGSKEGITFL